MKYSPPDSLSFGAHRETTQMMLDVSEDADEILFLKRLLSDKMDLVGPHYSRWRRIKRLRL